MKQVPYPPGFKQAKTYYCTKCNRFTQGVGNSIPPCPVHGNTMVDNPSHPDRVEIDAIKDDPGRRKKFSRVYNQEDVIEKTKTLEGLCSVHPIPVIFNREDEDLANEVVLGLVSRNQQSAMSIPEPRHTWSGCLDPNWFQKYKPTLEVCEFAVYVKRKGTQANAGTQSEIDILNVLCKTIYVYEQ